MAGDNQVNTVHGLGQFLVLGDLQAVSRAGVRQADDELRSPFFQGLHAPLRRLRGGLQLETRCRGTVIGVHAHQAEDAVGDAAPLQKHGLLYAVVVHGLLDIIPVRVFGGRPVVGLQQSGNHIAAVQRRVQHPGEALAGMVELVVADRGGVIAQRAHGPQLGGLSGIEGLDQ